MRAKYRERSVRLQTKRPEEEKLRSGGARKRRRWRSSRADPTCLVGVHTCESQDHDKTPPFC